MRTDEGHGIHRYAAWDFWGREGHVEQVKDGKGGKCRAKRWRPAGGVNVKVDV